MRNVKGNEVGRVCTISINVRCALLFADISAILSASPKSLMAQCSRITPAHGADATLCIASQTLPEQISGKNNPLFQGAISCNVRLRFNMMDEKNFQLEGCMNLSLLLQNNNGTTASHSISPLGIFPQSSCHI